jgi:hypothetical protein
MTRDLLKLAPDDMHGEKMHVHSLEWGLKRAHLIEHHTKGPDVTLEAVWSTLDDLRGQVVWCTNHGPRDVNCVLEDPGNSKVSQLDNSLLCHKHILAFYISVQNFTVMHMLHAQTDLSEPVENLALGEVAAMLLLNLLC